MFRYRVNGLWGKIESLGIEFYCCKVEEVSHNLMSTGTNPDKGSIASNKPILRTLIHLIFASKSCRVVQSPASGPTPCHRHLLR